MTQTAFVRWTLGIVLCAAAAGCGGGDRGRVAFRLSLQGLSPLPAGQGWYEGFAIGKDGLVRSTGKFNLDASTNPPQIFTPRGDVLGTTTSAVFGPANTYLGEAFPFIWDAASFFVTIEPEGDVDEAPSGNVLLAGALAADETADLTTLGLLATNGPGLGDFSNAAGTAVLTSPTDGPGNEAAGLWFATDASGVAPGLVLPVLTGGMTYEAFVSPDGVQFTSLGRFRDPADFDDDFMAHLGRADLSTGFRLPGQDAVQAFSFARPSAFDVADGGRRVEITVEPARDNSRGAFPLVVLSAVVPTSAVSAQKIAAQDNALTNHAASLPAYALTATAGAVDLVAGGGVLGALGASRDGRYELFAVVGGAATSCGAFEVQAVSGTVTAPNGVGNYGTAAHFTLTAANTGLGVSFPDVVAATEFFVTVEPVGDPAPQDSGVVVLAGAATGGAATLTVAGASATGGRGLANFAAAAGSFICRTPTDDVSNATANDQFGVWFRFLNSDTASLVLPALPAAWSYEAWAVEIATGARTSLGRFRNVAGPDDDAVLWPGRGGDSIGFFFPGQDLLLPVADETGVVGDFRGGQTVVVSIEATPRLSTAPSAYRVLQGTTPPTASAFSLTNVFTAPTGRLEI